MPERPSDLPPQPDLDAPVPGRGQRHLSEAALQHLKASWLLRACAVLAFLGYGGLVALVLAGKLPFTQAGMVALMSLGSWFFLFWLYASMERALARLGQEARKTPVRGTLEAVAVGCIVVVHLLMTVIVVYSARR